MPDFPEKGEPTLSEGSFKTAYHHKHLHQYLVLERNEKEISWLEQISERSNWSNEEKHAFFCSQFYLRKLLHVLFPESFARVTYIDKDYLVTKEVHGDLVRWSQLSRKEQAHFLKACESLGINWDNIDDWGFNFVVEEYEGIPTGNIIYIDDVVCMNFFNKLAEEMAKPKVGKTVAAGSIQSDSVIFYKDIVNHNKLDQLLSDKSNGLSEHQRATAKKIWERFLVHASKFQGLEMPIYSNQV